MPTQAGSFCSSHEVLRNALEVTNVRVSLSHTSLNYSSPGWPQTHCNPLSSASAVLGSQVCPLHYHALLILPPHLHLQNPAWDCRPEPPCTLYVVLESSQSFLQALTNTSTSLCACCICVRMSVQKHMCAHVCGRRGICQMSFSIALHCSF